VDKDEMLKALLESESDDLDSTTVTDDDAWLFLEFVHQGRNAVKSCGVSLPLTPQKRKLSDPEASGKEGEVEKRRKKD
jgi:5-formyltetrahydrofolate cyclo-ligase